jgi:hypothetical protein
LKQDVQMPTIEDYILPPRMAIKVRCFILMKPKQLLNLLERWIPAPSQSAAS